jgi:S-adenosyl-L-methionine hydrolase (adenosine-forming)
MARPIVTLTTDFGLSDHFVGTMKGVIAGLAPEAQLVDISHLVSPFDIVEGAFVVAEAYRYFPKGSVHLVVVDPGVGTQRRAIVAEAAGQFFVAPDNGVLSLLWAREPKAKVREVTARRYFLKPVSDTFQGRDIFAPVAGRLAGGTPAARFGKRIEDYFRLASLEPVRTGKRTWQGRILKIDHFGNLITNFAIGEFEALRSHAFVFECGQRQIVDLARTFAEVKAGELSAIVGSAGYIEIVTNQGSAARLAACAAGAPVELTVY